MKITSIKATNVFSFREIEVTLDNTLTVVVGPNGGGKTNLVRSLDIVRSAVRATVAGTQRPGLGWIYSEQPDAPG